MAWWEAGARILLAILIGLAIGYERERRNKPAGTRTHILVCLGAALIAVMENYVEARVLAINSDGLNTGGAVRMGRISAQVVSGIGFLGAGTIFSSRKKIAGLTTAASLWCAGCLGLVAGMGCYTLALSGCTLVLLTLTIVQRIIPATTIRQVEIQYDHRVETTGYIKAFFAAHSVDVLNVDFHSENSKNERAYTSIYTVRMSARVNLVDLFGPLSEYEHVRAFRIRQPQ